MLTCSLCYQDYLAAHLYMTNKLKRNSSKMDWQDTSVKALAPQSDDLNLISGTHKVKEKNLLPCMLFCGLHTPSHRHTDTHTIKGFFSLFNSKWITNLQIRELKPEKTHWHKYI